MGHDLAAVEVRADGGQLLLLAQLGDAGLEVVHALRQGPGPGRVAGRAVGAGQLVELLQQVAGIAHVTTDGAVRPAHAIGVEPKMELHQPPDLVDVLGRVAQGPHAVPGHAGADHLMVVEAHRAAGAERTRLGLADVVEERGQAHDPVGPCLLHHGDGVGQDVLVAMDGVLLEGQGGQFGEELLGQARS